MTLNRHFLHGALAIAGVASSFGFATSAQAALFTVSQLNTPGFVATVGDKAYSGFSIPTGTGLFDGTDSVSITVLASGTHQIDFLSTTTGGNLTSGGTLTYDVSILPGFTNTFSRAQQDTQGDDLTGGAFTRTFTPTGLTPTSLVYSSGAPLPGNGTFDAGLKTTSVTDTWTITPTASINSFSDRYLQTPPFPQPPIPEPSAVLGLLALGLCGTLVGRKKG